MWRRRRFSMRFVGRWRSFKPQVASIDIGFTSPDREKAALIANAVADAYVVDQLEAKFQATRQATEWLDARLAELRVQLDESERAVEIFRAENDLLSASTEGGTLNEQQLSELNGQLITARADLAAKQVRYQRLQQLVRQGGSIETAGEVMSSGVIGGLRQQQAELARRQAELSSRYGPRHPEILKVQAEQRDPPGKSPMKRGVFWRMFATKSILPRRSAVARRQSGRVAPARLRRQSGVRPVAGSRT